MGTFPLRKSARALGLAACLAAAARAEIIDFENPAYAADKTLAGVDGWVLSGTDPLAAQEDFRIQAGPAGQGRWAHVQTAGTASVYRPLGSAPGNASLLDVRWRWRGLSDSAHFCVGISGNSGTARQSNRALACLDPFGAISVQGATPLPLATAESWHKGAWQYARMVLDAAGTAGKFTLYLSDDSLRAAERLAATGILGGSGSFARFVLRGEGGSGFADADDFSWEPIAQWQPAADGDTAWGIARNWSTGAVPDSATRVLFPDGGTRGCLLDRNASVMSVTVSSGFKGVFNLGAQTLGLLGGADFTGGAAASGAGQIRFPGARSASLIGPQGTRPLPALRHDGPGLLRLDGRALSAAGFLQSGGPFDFNGFDLFVIGDWVVKSGRPGTLRNLDGRAIIATGSARLEGVSPDTLLGLASAPNGWTLNASGTDSLIARYASLGNARATGNPGYAYASVDAGGNSGWAFPKRLGPPEVTPKGRTFPDTLRVRASAGAGETVRYTLDGTDPGPASPPFPAQGILLDSSADLKAVTVSAGEIGPAAAESYLLVPDTPAASPRGGDYSSPVRIALASAAPRAVVYYTLDGSEPGPELGLPYSGPIALDTNAVLKAVAIAGQGAKARRGPVLIENYAFIATGKRTLGPGRRLALSGNYSLASPYAGAASVDVEVLAADSVAGKLKGFRDVLFGVRLSPSEGAGAFPKVSFNSPAGEPRALYQLAAPGIVRWIAASDTAPLNAPGTYFLAIDTAAPTVRYAGETFTAEDSTRLVVTIEDNVQNLALDLERSDDASADFTGREVSPILILAVNAKNPPGALKPLTVRLKVSDHTRATAFPADGSAYPLAQKIADGVRSPAAFHIGADAQDPWDLISVPLAADRPITLSQLRKSNSEPGLQGATLDPATGKYRFLSGDEAIPPGRSLWLAAPASLPSLALPAVQTTPRRGAAAWSLTLHPGWSHVADPGLAPLWWPATRTRPESYRSSLLKGLHTWDAATGAYVHAESLEPWRGYFAYYYGGRDTVIHLLEAPLPPDSSAPAAPKGAAGLRKAAGMAGIGLKLAWPGGAGLVLGAAVGASDGFGLEDEARPPCPGADGTRLFSVRAGTGLETDIQGWRPGAVYAWKVVAGLSARAADPQGNREATESLSASAEQLPAGYAAWAVSRARGLRFPLALPQGTASPGGNPVALPWQPGYADTLEVLAGPAAALESRLAPVPLRPGPFAARMLPSPGSYLLQLDLPDAARLRLTVSGLDGRVAEDRVLDLPAGRYRLPGPARLAPGLYAARLRFAGPEGIAAGARMPASAALKLAVP